MSISTPYRLCPKCGSQRGVEEVVCANDINGVPCSWDLTSEEIRDGHGAGSGDPIAHGAVGKSNDAQRRCPNGHAASPGDLICPECNADLQASEQDREIADWVVLTEVPVEGGFRTRFRVRRRLDGREAVLTLYSPGSEPDTTVYEALQKRVPRDHIAELLEFGRWEGRAYEVAEEILGGSLATLELDPSDTAAIQHLVEEIGKALASFMDVGLRHRALSPEKVLLRSREPLDVVITGFESGRLSDLDLDVESPLEVTRYTAPEAIMGGVASASDWWSLGIILLGSLTRGECFAGINDQLFLIHVNANGAPIPQGLDPRLELLLQGLLTVDRSQRWQWKEVRSWLDGETPPVAKDHRGGTAVEIGPALSLGGKAYTDARRFAIDASRAANWAEACDLLAHGQIARWAEDLKLDGKTVSGLRDLGQRIEPAVGLRLGVALQMLNPQLPLILEEAIVNPAWLLNNTSAGYELVTGPIPDLLSQYGLQTDNWLRRLAKRAAAIRARAQTLEITLDEEAFQVLALSTSRAKLTAAWEARRRDFPDASHPSLSSIIARKQYSDEDLILLLAASLDQFRSCEEIIQDVGSLASRYGLAVPATDQILSHLASPRRDLYALLDERIAGFARCGQERCDAWADQFRLERRLPIANVLVLLDVPPGRWTKPPHQDYVSSILDFFEKKVSGAILRGQLVRMTIAKTTPRIDLVELAPDLDSAAALLENLLQRSDRTFRLDAQPFERPDGPEKRMRNLLSRTLQYQRDTGINGTYVGFPFILRRDRAEKSAPRLAPILLWPVKVVGQVGSRGDFSLAFDSEGREVLLNPAFTGMFGLEGAKEWQAIADDVLMRSVAKLGDIVDAFGIKAAPAGRTLQPLPRDLSGVAAGEEHCICSAVLFHMEFMGQSLVEDLRQLKQRPPENTALEPMLRVAELGPESAKNPSDTNTHIPISDKFLITHSDPSQEEAIARARSAPGLLIQGPPGTGKSQTIVNLVADCIGHRKSVLIVCQKLPALEVVRKRLVAEGLENRLAMVTNVVKDRQPLLRSIREQLDTITETNPADAQHNEREAAGLASQIEKLESQIDSQYHAAARADEVSGRAYRKLLADLIALEENGPRKPPDAAGLRRLLADKSDVAVADLEESCGAVAAQWLEADYENSPLSATLQFPHDDATIAEFRAAFEDFKAAELLRASLPQHRNASLPNPPPEGLDDWLRKHRGRLENLTDSQLTEAVPLLSLFRDGSVGDQYCTLLESLLPLQRGYSRTPLATPALDALLAPLSLVQADALASLCGQHASTWLAAHYEGSPLHVLKDFAAEPEVCRSLKSALEGFEASERHRTAITQKHAHVIQSGDPDQLALWLEAHAAFLKGLTAEHLHVFTEVGSVFEPDVYGSRYINTLERLATLSKSGLPLLEAPEALQRFVEKCDEAAVDLLAEQMAQHVLAWLDANYEDTPLRVLSSFGNDERTHGSFKQDLTALLSAEEARAALGPPSRLAMSLKDSLPLAAWLGKYGSLLRSVSETRLEEVASRLSLLESPAVVSAYIRLLQHSLAVGPPPEVDERLLSRLQEIVGPLSDSDITSVTDDCIALAPLWRVANFEKSPLRVLMPFAADQHTCDEFRTDFEALASAEDARVALGPPEHSARKLHDPQPLAAWLDSAGPQLIEAFDSQPDTVSRLLPVAMQGDFLDRYEEVLKQLKAVYAASPQPLPYVSALEHLLVSVPDALAAQVERESMSAAGVWLDSGVDKVLLESLAGFPRDASHATRLRDGLHRLAEVERQRLALAARCPQSLHVTDATAARTWLTQYGQSLAAVPADLAAFLAVAYQTYDRGPTGKSPAEVLFSDVKKLRADLRELRLTSYKQPVLDRLCETPQETLASLASAVATLRRRILLGFLSPSNRKARKLLATWQHESGITGDTLSHAALAEHLKAASAVHGIHHRASTLLVSAGLPAPPSHWQQLDVHLKQLCEFFPAAHGLRAAVVRCPVTFNRQRLLQNATPSALRQFVEVVRDGTAAHAAKEGSLAALQAIMPYMASSWLAERKASIESNKPSPNDDLAVGRLIEAIGQLDKVQAFRDRVAGCQPLTLKALGALTAIRESLRKNAPNDHKGLMQAVFRQHRLLARKRHLEAGHPNLPSLGVLDGQGVATLLEGVEATRRIRECLKACPTPDVFLEALASGLPSRVSDALHESRVAVMHARAVHASDKALLTCEKWFQPPWIQHLRQHVQAGKDTTPELNALRSALPTLSAYQRVRITLEHSSPAVAKALPLVGRFAEDLTKASPVNAANVRALMMTAWCEAQRHLLTTHNSLLGSLGECRSQAQQEEALGTLLGGRDISEALLACPVTGDLHASLTSGSRSTFLESLDALEAAVAYSRATLASEEALAVCAKWFESGFVQKCQEAHSRGVAFADVVRGIADALPTLGVYQSLDAALHRPDAELLRAGFKHLAESRSQLHELPRDFLPANIRQLIAGTWLHLQKHRLEEAEVRLRKIGSISGYDFELSLVVLRVTQDVVRRLGECPAQQELRAALASADPACVSSTVAALLAGIELHHAQQASLVALDKLEDHFSSEWVTALRTAIYKGDSNEGVLRPVLAASPTIEKYQQFRSVLATSEPLVGKLLTCFTDLRAQLDALPGDDIGGEVQRAVRHAALTGTKLRMEQDNPALHAIASASPRDSTEVIEVLLRSKQLHNSVQTCPLSTLLATCVSQRQVEVLRRLLQEFADSAEHWRVAQGAVKALRGLSDFMRPEWIDAVIGMIQRGEDTQSIREMLEAAFPTLRAYQLFRSRTATLPESATRCFEALSKYRGALQGAADAVEGTGVGDLVRQVIRREALLGWKNRLEAQDPSLLADGAELAAKVDRLRKLDIALRALNRQRLSQDLPIQSIESRNEWTDITRLSGPRAIRLREFFGRGSDLGLLALRPVWLTTPDVASQLLPLDKALFDLVIFDEASQMPVEYALPCLYRAKAAVVSGDDKQMPPSSFFAGRIENDEAEAFDGEMPDEAATEQEREAFEQAWNRREIKDCPDLLHLGDAVLRRATLQVHYRSEYRELIGYSNAAFYQNELGVPVRHPDAAVRLAKPIEYLGVSGTYVNQTNPDEARRVVELLGTLWLEGAGDPPSVGVVTFNLRQAELIEELLEERAEADEAFRLAYAREQSRTDRGEDMSVFVKNVENVQGDERDLIIFSTTFGPTDKGLFRRNFGALGQKGGERRLNVAVTRARRKVIIVSSMPIDDVSDMLRTRRKPETPRDYLQAYLQYARFASDGYLEEARRLAGRLATGGKATEASAGSGDGFLDSVASFIRSLGYEPVNTANDPILGVDFSIADPVTGSFGVGIECDPPRHRLTQRARAREIWRPSVLERAYRVVHRVSPYAWYHDRDGEQQRLRKVIVGALGKSPAKHGQPESENP